MRIFFIFIIFILLLSNNATSLVEINPRGIPITYKIQRKKVKGYIINDASLFEAKKNLQNLLKNSKLNENQIKFFIDFYINTGFAESCYAMDSIIFSVEKQVNGQALGFIQIPLNTAISVVNEVLKSENEEYISMIENICEKSFGTNLDKLKKEIKENTIYTLNDHEISMFVFYLKFSNRGWKDIPGFLNGNIQNTIKFQAEIWKKVWNTYLGKGTIEKYIKNVVECKTII